ncbi:MAG TPA: nucleotidyltransferase [Pseudobacteroides sp.]|uniref:nucleotidyltransferase n=1 Tax=Pseudobacteroides sp. TaxID=1968840 RepID=UPI002F94CA3B
MTVLGLIVEYNPFHNGHKYHMEEAQKLTNADFTVCIMSGNFIQRGEPAIVNKWARSRMALMSGADLVIELPTVYSMASAEYFAYGAVKLLDSLGIVDYICFGSESGNIEDLELIADVLINEPEAFKSYLQKSLSEGHSYPLSREKALSMYFTNYLQNPDMILRTIASSNNILGIEYIKAVKRLNSNIKFQTIKRISNDYNSEEVSGSISSATAVRKFIGVNQSTNSLANLESLVPTASFSALMDEFSAGRGPVFSHSFENYIIGLLRKMSLEEIKNLPYVSEGLENRIKKSAEDSGTLENLISGIATKRFTRTRIQRIIFSVLTGLTQNMFNSFNSYGGPQYVRILGFNTKGRVLLKRMKPHCTLPIITKTSQFKNSCNPMLRKMLQLESESTDLYVLGYKNPKFKKAGQDFTQNPVMIYK